MLLLKIGVIKVTFQRGREFRIGNILIISMLSKILKLRALTSMNVLRTTLPYFQHELYT